MSNSSMTSFSTRIAYGVGDAATLISMVSMVLKIVKLCYTFIYWFLNLQTATLTFMCEICADEKPKIENFRVSGCDHSYCSECMESFVAFKLQDNVVAINCPVSGCKSFLEPQHCASILPKQVFDRWNDALCDTFVVENIKLVFDDDVKRVLKGECSSPQTAPLTFFCEICADEKPEIENFRVSGCDHSYCSECMESFVAFKLQDNVVAINCPVSGCKAFLEPQHCASILPKQVFDRWNDALCEAVILATEKFYCPFKDCSALLVDDTKGKNEVIAESECPDCHRLFCAQCKVPWHSGIDCAGFKKLNKDERSREDIMLLNLAKNQKWTRCPQCNFMKCRCGNNFCYYCGLPNVKQSGHVCARNKT